MNQSLRDAAHDARLAVDLASEAIASDILLLDISNSSDFADYFVIMSASSVRQINSLSESIDKGLRDAGLTRHHKEGIASSGWVLLDFGDLIIHIFGIEQREHYNLESAWSQATEVIRLQ